VIANDNQGERMACIVTGNTVACVDGSNVETTKGMAANVLSFSN